MKRRSKAVAPFSGAGMLFFLFMFLGGTPVFAAVSSGYSEYIVPGDEEIVHAILDELGDGDQTSPNADTHSYIAVTVWSDNTTIYYDHWEDGYDFDRDDPSTADETYTLANRGESQIFEGTNIPTDPRGTATYYDGRDRIFVAGGAVTVSRSAWTESAGTLLALAWEVYPIRPQLITYILPFGENLADPAGDDLQDFERVYALVQATADNTVVTIDFDGDGTPDQLDQNRDGDMTDPGDDTTVELDQGEVYRLDNVSSTAISSLDSGTVINGNQTIQVQYIVGDQGSNYEVRGLSAFPRGFWDDEYYAPVDSANDAEGDVDIYLYNPQDAPLVLSYSTASGSGSFTIATKTTASFEAKTGNYAPLDSSVYFTAPDEFWGISTIDTSAGDGNSFGAGRTHDWAYSLVPALLLENEHFMGWAPGSEPVGTGAAADNSGIFLAPVEDNTQVFVDFDNDGTADQTYSLNSLETQYIFDPNDGDMSEANIYATGPYVAAYGQNPELAPGAAPAIDVGYTTLPTNQFMELVLTVDKNVDPGVVPYTSGSQATFILEVNSYDFAVDDIAVVDSLPTGWQYVDDSTTITLADKSTISGNAADPGINDGGGPNGEDVLTWPHTLLSSMAANQIITIEFTGETTQSFATGDFSRNQVEAAGTRTVEGVTQTFTTSDFAFISYGNYSVGKTTGGVDPLSPGDQYTYTVEVSNPPATGFRVTEYYLEAGDFTGTVYDLALDQDLDDDYFVIVRGSDSDGGGTGASIRGPDENYVALTADPFGTGDLATSSGSDVIRLERGNSVDDWIGVVTVVESLQNQATGGFTLLDVQRVSHTAGDTGDTDTSDTAWSDIDQVMLLGGFYGAGCNTSETSNNNHVTCFARIWPSGTDTINWSRDAGGRTLGAATSTVMVLEWGSEWTVQRVNVTGNNGGNGADDNSEYNTAAISSVARANTWVWGTGHTNEDGLGDGGEGVLVTLGDGVNQNANEDSVAVATEFGSNIDFTVYALTHDELAVDYRFKADGDSGSLTVDVSVDEASDNRMALVYNGCNGTGTYYPRPVFSARYTTDTTVRLERRFTGQDFPAWVQGIQFPGDVVTLTDIAVYDPLPDGVSYIAGTANVTAPYGNLQVLDQFSTVAYDNNDGTDNWSGNWIEDDEDGGGAGPGSGRISIASDELALTNSINYNNANDPSAARQVDLSGADSATLSFDYRTAGNLEGSDQAVVEISDNGGTSYTVLQQFFDTVSGSASYDISSYMSAATRVRFRLADYYGAGDEYFYVDNVEIQATVTGVSRAVDSPPNLISASDGYFLYPGTSLTLTYDVVVDDPLATGIDEIVNTVSVTSSEFPVPLKSRATNIVVNPSTQSASAGDRVWFDVDGDGVQDVGEPGFANVELTLKDVYGTPVAITSTNSNGYYLFTNIEPDDDYYVEITGGLPAGLVQTIPAGRSDDRTDPFDLDAGDIYTDADLGYTGAAGTATIGDRVWHDVDQDARQDSGEPGLAGVTVALYEDVDGDGVLEPGGDDGAAIETTTTTSDGTYLFVNVTAGGTEDYFVYVDDSQAALSNYNPVAGVERLVENVGAGDVLLNNDFGFYTDSGHTTYTITDRVWYDADEDAQDDGESGLANVTVDLLDASLNVITGAVTDADGYFSFSGVEGGGADYTIRITDTGDVLSDYFGTTSAAVAGDLEIINLTGDIDYTAEPDEPNFGYYSQGTVGDTVFNDIDGDGVQALDEPGISGVTVELYEDVDGDGVYEPDGDDGGSIASLVTGVAGRYLFSGLDDGTYFVTIDDTQAALNGFSLTTADDEAAEAGHQQEETLTGGNSNLNADFGYQAGTQRTVSGVVWEDEDEDGLNDGGEDIFTGVTISLLRDGIVSDTTETDANGAYAFTGLSPGIYVVRMVDASGILNGYDTVYEVSEGSGAASYDNEETVDVTGSDASGVDFGYKEPIPTLALISSFTTHLVDGIGVIEWQTAAEFGTVGFDLYRYNGSTDRFDKVNAHLLSGLQFSPQGGTYSYPDNAVVPGRTYTYKLVETTVRGRRLHYGPFTVVIGAGGDAISGMGRSNIRPLQADTLGRSEAGVACGFRRSARSAQQAYQDRSRAAGKLRDIFQERKRFRRSSSAKLEIVDRGIYYVSISDLAELMNLSAAALRRQIRNRNVALTHMGEDAAYYPDPSGDGFYFYGNGLPQNIYTNRDIYWLGRGRGITMDVSSEQREVSGATGTETFMRTVIEEKDIYPAPTRFFDPDADFLVWDYVLAFSPGAAKSFNIDSPGVDPAAAEATLTVYLKGAGDTAVNPDHHVEVYLNNTYVGEGFWDGIESKEIPCLFSPSLLNNGGNTVELVAPLDTGAAYSTFYIDSLELKYPSFYHAKNGRLLCDADNNDQFIISGFSDPDIMVLDISDPDRPRIVATQGYAAGDNTYNVNIAPDYPEAVYFAATAAEIGPVANQYPDNPSELCNISNAADYLIITTEALESAAEELAVYRSGQGLKTQVVLLEDIMDEFNCGLFEPSAIKDFLAYAYDNWLEPPFYVVLAGDGSFDYKDNQGFGDCLIPPIMTATPHGLFALDSRFGDVRHNDGLPEFAVGRIPVLTPEELAQYARKVMAFEAEAAWKQGVAIIADQPASGETFAADSDTVAELFPAGYYLTKIYVPDHTVVDARQMILDTIAAGTGYVNYIGHAGFDRFSKNNLLSVADVPGMNNRGMPFLLTASTCIIGQFSLPGFSSLGEALTVTNEDIGAAAVWASGGLSSPGQAIILEEAFYQGVFQRGKNILGKAIRYSKEKAYEQGVDTHMLYMNNLLGDPALVLMPENAVAGDPFSGRPMSYESSAGRRSEKIRLWLQRHR